MSAPAGLDGAVDQFTRRLLIDCLNDATRTYWLRRAEIFEAARPRPDEFHGASSRDTLRQQWYRLTATAAACRARAKLCGDVDHAEVEVAEVLREAS